MKLTDDERLAHRVLVTKVRPALPACAGRALRQLTSAEPGCDPVRVGRVRIYPLLRPQPDLHKMALALLDHLARRHMDGEHEKPSPA